MTMLTLENTVPMLGLAPPRIGPMGQYGDISALLASLPQASNAQTLSTINLDNNMYAVQVLNGCTTLPGLAGIQCVSLPGGTICCPCYQGFPAAAAPQCTAVATAAVSTVTALTAGYPQQPLATGTLSQQPPNGTFHPAALSLPNQISSAQNFRHLQSSYQQQQQNGTPLVQHSPNFNHNQRIHPGYNRSSFPPKGLKRKADDAMSTDSTDSGNGKSEGSTASGEVFLQPLYCKICRVTLNAPAQAKQHYEGKNHAKKVKLTECSNSSSSTSDGTPTMESTTQNSTDETSSSPTKEQQPPPPPVEINPQIYCKTCGVSFNSDKQANQHYQGKNHAKKVRVTDGDKGRGSFRRGSRFRCFLCNLHLGSKDQLLSHLRGPRHQEKIKAQGGAALGGRWHSKDATGPFPFGITQISYGPGFGVNHGFNRPFLKDNGDFGRKPNRDFTMYRTPSGKFYCPACNIAVNSEMIFGQHLNSKKHKCASIAHRIASRNTTENTKSNTNNTVETDTSVSS